jgi:hypothetical protein
MGLPLTGDYMGTEVGSLCREISEAEVENDRPMLSAIVVTIKGTPGGGFYKLAKHLGRLKDESAEGKRRFWEAEKAAVYNTWRVELKR